jgi:hypothetical protein
MTTFTSTLPDDLMEMLSEKALRIYLDQLNKAEYVKSYRNSLCDKDILTIAEEGMADYLKQIEDGSKVRYGLLI